MMSKRLLFKVFLLACAVLFLPVLTKAADSTATGYILRNSVINNGGAYKSATGYKSLGSLGQSSVGKSTATGFQLGSGSSAPTSASSNSSSNSTSNSSTSGGGGIYGTTQNYSFVINGGAQVTDSPLVVLFLKSTFHATTLEISRSLDFSSAVRENYEPFKNFSLCSSNNCPDGLYTIFVRLYDETGASVLLENSIFLQRAISLRSIGLYRDSLTASPSSLGSLFGVGDGGKNISGSLLPQKERDADQSASTSIPHVSPPPIQTPSFLMITVFIAFIVIVVLVAWLRGRRA